MRPFFSARYRGSARACRWLSLALCGTSLLAATSGWCADRKNRDAEEAFFQGLRDRRLFRLAESHCLRRLNEGDLPADRRVFLLLELARTFSEHATLVDEPEQTNLQNQARATLDEFLGREPNSPWRIALETERALVSASAGNWHRWLYELDAEDVAALELASKELRAAIESLESLEPQLADNLKKGSRIERSGEPTAYELRRLQGRLREHLGFALLDLGALQPAGSPERETALRKAQRVLKPLAESSSDEPGTWPARVAQVAAFRLLGETERAVREFQNLKSREPPRSIADRLLAEWVRILVDMNRFSEAETVLEARDELAALPPGELLFLNVQVPVIKLRREAEKTRPERAEEQLSAVAERVERVRREAGGIWSWRAAYLFELTRDELQYGHELAALVRRAQSEFRRGDLAAASQLYGQAITAANKAGKPDIAFHLGLTRGSIEVEAREFGVAADDLLELVEAHPQHPKAAEAHLLAAYALGRLFEEKQTRSRREDYTQALEAHRARFTDHATLGEATWMLAGLQERRGQFTVALKLFREIPQDHTRGSVALVAVARCYERILERLREIGQPAEPWEREAVSILEAGLPSTEESPLSDLQCDVAIRLARIQLHRHPPEYAAADRWLLRVLASISKRGESPEGESQLSARLAQALGLHIVSLAGQGKFQEARSQLEQVSVSKPRELLAILEGLAPLSASDQQDPFRDLGTLQLEAAVRLNEHRAGLSPEERRRLDECLARGYVTSGKRAQGFEIYESLLKQHPKDATLKSSFATLLSQARDKSWLERGLVLWKELETHHEAGSEAWLGARYERCRCLQALDRKAEACRLLKATRGTYPKLGGEKLYARFAELEAKCARPAEK